MRLRKNLIAAALLLASGAIPAVEADCDGCRDHPLLPRYPGSQLVGHERHAFDHGSYVQARRADGEDGTAPSDLLQLDGERTRLFYWQPEGRSGLEVYANYRDALARAGWTILWSCSGSDPCGSEFAAYAIESMHLDMGNTTEARQGAADAEDPRYVLAKLQRAQGDVYAAVLVADLPLHTPPRAGAYVMVTEARAMDSGMVQLDANALARSLAETRRAVTWGIRFDFDKADIRPESRPQLEQIARLLADQPRMRLLITGHTDDRGSAQYNLGLSQRRAEAIVAALVDTYGIAPDRLTALGRGATSPIASNATEEGQARNRRVELIEQ